MVCHSPLAIFIACCNRISTACASNVSRHAAICLWRGCGDGCKGSNSKGNEFHNDSFKDVAWEWTIDKSKLICSWPAIVDSGDD